MKNVLALTGSLLLCLHASAALAESNGVEQAREHFLRGVDFYKDQSYDAALAEFSRAYELSPNYRVLYNLAQVQLDRHDYAAGLKLYQSYLDGGGTEIPESRRQQVTEEIAQLQKRVGRLRVRCDVPGAEVSIAGTIVAKTPMGAAVLVNPGVVQLSVTKPGYVTDSRTLSVVGAEEQSVEVTLAREPSAGSSAPIKSAPPAPVATPVDRSAMWLSLGVTGAFAIGTGIVGLRTRKANSDLDERLNAFPSDRAAIDDARSQLKNFALATDVLAGCTAVAAGFTVYFALSSPSQEDRAKTRVGVGTLPGAAGLRLLGDF